MSNRRIFDHEPNDWEELEALVAQAFDEMGYHSERRCKVDTARGQVELDVYAVDSRTPITTTVACECKHWNRRVSQDVIYAFRSVCADLGVHYGLIISSKGFQAGAADSRVLTNVHLLDFQEFQEAFFDRWREGLITRFVQMHNEFVVPLFESDTTRHAALDKYRLLSGVHDHFMGNKAFPAKLVDPRGDIHEIVEVEVLSHRHFLEIANEAYRGKAN